MSGNFDWQTEDEIRQSKAQAAWDDAPEPRAPVRQSRRIPWRLLAVVAVLLAGVGLIVWWRVQARIDATMQALSNDVASSFNLLQLAAAEQDEELFRSVLSGRDPGWTTAQLELFEAGLLINRTQLGLTAAPGSLPKSVPLPFDEALADESAVAIEFSPDLNEAIVTSVQPFTVSGGSSNIIGDSGTVLLEQTTIFRRGQQRWLLAPAGSDFWGDWQSTETDRLTVLYPQRDAELGDRLAEDMNAAVDELCLTVADLDCPDNLRLIVRLEKDTSALTIGAVGSGVRSTLRDTRNDGELVLPTPTLVGRPIEEGEQAALGYQALLNAYLPAVLQNVVAESTGWTCCQQGFLFQVLFDHQLAQLGYSQWPVDRSAYQQVLDERVRLSDIGYLWRRTTPDYVPAEDQWRLYVVVDFLLNVFPDLSAAKMQALLPIAPNMEEWLSRLVIENGDSAANTWVLNSLDQAWWLFALQGSLDEGEPPIPPADEALYLACTAEDGGQRAEPASVYRYDVADARWENMLTVEGFVWMSPLPTPDTLLMQEFLLAEETWQTNVWRGSMRNPLYRTETGFSISFGETDPEGRYLVTYAWEPEQEQTRALLLDLGACSDEGCDYGELQGLPVWSPDGQRAVYSGDRFTLPDNTLITNERIIIFDPGERFFERPLSVGSSPSLPDAPETTPVGIGYSPFWLDEQTFGYIRVIRDGEPGPVVDEEVVVATLDDTAPRPIISSADLFQFLPEGQDASRVTLAYVAPHPIDRELVFVVAVDELQKMAFVFSYDLSTRLPMLRLQVRYDLNHSFSFSPDGRYLIVTGRDRASVGPSDNSGVLYLHHIADNTTTPFAIRLPFFLSSVTYDWTDDSNWLALAMDDNLLAFVSPDQGYVQPITHSYGTCTSVAWLQE